MTFDLLSDDKSIESYTLSAQSTAFVIQNPDRESNASISLQLTASRYLVSADDYESAVVYTVLFTGLSYCTIDRECLCLKPNVKYM